MGILGDGGGGLVGNFFSNHLRVVAGLGDR